MFKQGYLGLKETTVEYTEWDYEDIDGNGIAHYGNTSRDKMISQQFTYSNDESTHVDQWSKPILVEDSKSNKKINFWIKAWGGYRTYNKSIVTFDQPNIRKSNNSFFAPSFNDYLTWFSLMRGMSDIIIKNKIR